MKVDISRLVTIMMFYHEGRDFSRLPVAFGTFGSVADPNDYVIAGLQAS